MIRIRYKFYTELQTDSKHLYDKKLEGPHMKMFLEEKIQSQCLKIAQKVAFNIASEASYVYILRSQNSPFGGMLENLKPVVKQCYQTGQLL